MRLLQIAAAIALFISSAAGQGTTFKRAFNAVTTTQASAAMPNSGQAVHLLTVLFPTASADVSSFTIRLEASQNPSDVSPVWFPISEDITGATYITTPGGNFAYSVTRANGVYPAVRVRYVAAHASLPLTAYYSGGLYPIGQVKLESGRYIVGSPGGAGGDKVTWGVCIGQNCAIGANLTANYVVTASRTISKCYASAKTAPTGANLVVDINKNGATIFTSGFSLTPGSTYATTSTFASASVAEGDILTIDIDQVGSTVPGKDITVVCTLQ